jgi:hypothetical protein
LFEQQSGRVQGMQLRQNVHVRGGIPEQRLPDKENPLGYMGNLMRFTPTPSSFTFISPRSKLNLAFDYAEFDRVDQATRAATNFISGNFGRNPLSVESLCKFYSSSLAG